MTHATGQSPPTAETLRAGGVVAFPTDTVYALACRADMPDALDTLWRIKGEDRRGPLAWHLASTEEATRVITPRTPAHKRVTEKLLPLAATIAAPLTDTARSRDDARIAPGVADDATHLLVRAPAHALTHAVIAGAGGPIVMAGALPAEDDPLPVRTPDDAGELLARIDPDALVGVALHDASSRPTSAPSTLIRLDDHDAWHVTREGALSQTAIERAVYRTILFVCTGNTCRSPMAEAIARHELSDEQRAYTRIGSAGAFAGPGSPATPEAIDALRELGVSLEGHSSTPLTSELLDQADVVYAMTQSHLHAALDIDPGVRDRITLLDPGGRDVPDPIGQGMQVYRDTAGAIRDMIRARLAEAST